MIPSQGLPSVDAAISPPATPRLNRFTAIAGVILALGLFLRLFPSAAFTGIGFDEGLYREYVLKLDRAGLTAYPAICQLYLEDQRKPEVITKLPPTRFLFVLSAWTWKRTFFGDAQPPPIKTPNFAQVDPVLISLHRVAAAFTCLLFVLSGIFLWRTLPPTVALTAFALIACAPTQIHMAQHALIDGFFAFWATLCLWLLWENLQKPNHFPLLLAYGAALAMMVLTKENAFFVFVAMGGLILMNRWTKFGQVTPALCLCFFLGPLFGAITLLNLAGGFEPLIETYRLLVSKAETLTYAIKTGDGPWHRYLVDLMIVSPLVLCLALGGLFSGLRNNRPLLFLSMFVGISYAIMCNIRYGMNLRYATIWELPICALAAVQVSRLTPSFGRRERLLGTLLVIGLCAYSMRQYMIFFVDNPLYELASGGLLQVVKILK